MNQTAIVFYQVGQYKGEVQVSCDENDDYDYIINQAKRMVDYPQGCVYTSFRIIERYYD